METLLLCAGVFALSFLALVERWRGDTAPKSRRVGRPDNRSSLAFAWLPRTAESCYGIR